MRFSHQQTDSSHPAKENCPVSGNYQHPPQNQWPKTSIDHQISHFYGLKHVERNVSFEEAKKLCMKQEKQILSEIKAPNLEYNFYQYC